MRQEVRNHLADATSGGDGAARRTARFAPAQAVRQSRPRCAPLAAARPGARTPAMARRRRTGRLSSSGTAVWLAEKWVDQLGPSPLDGDSDFFEFGATSLAAARLVSVLRGRLPERRRCRRLQPPSPARSRSSPRRPRGSHDEGADGPDEPLPMGSSSARRRARLDGYRRAPMGAWPRSRTTIGTDLGVPQLGWAAIVAGWLLVSSAPGRSFVADGHALAVAPKGSARTVPAPWLACRPSVVRGAIGGRARHRSSSPGRRGRRVALAGSESPSAKGRDSQPCLPRLDSFGSARGQRSKLTSICTDGGSKMPSSSSTK